MKLFFFMKYNTSVILHQIMALHVALPLWFAIPLFNWLSQIE